MLLARASIVFGKQIYSIILMWGEINEISEILISTQMKWSVIEIENTQRR